MGADIELGILLQQQEEADKEAKRRRRESKVTPAGNDERLDATNSNTLGPQLTKGVSDESSDDEITTDKSKPPSLFMRAAQMDRIQRRTVEARPSHTSTAPFVPQMSDTSPRPNSHAFTVPSSPLAGSMSITSEFEYSQQPAMMIRQLRSMPTMPTAKFHAHGHPDDDDDLSQHTYSTPKKQQHLHATVALGVGLASAMKGGVGGNSINLRHSHNDIDAILSSPAPGGRNHNHNNSFQSGAGMYTSNTTMKAPNNDNNNKRSRSSTQDMTSIRDAYGTTRRGGKKMVGSKNSVPAWTDAPTDPEQAAAHKVALASSALKAELMKSLQSMQQHTEMVKDNILNVQHIVDVGTGRKPKHRNNS